MHRSMEWSWFRRPRGEDPGTTNLCYNAVDRHVVGGVAGEPALTRDPTVDFARLLEDVAALAGAFRGLGVDTTTPVVVALDDARDELLALLAAARLGAPVGLADDVPAALDRHRPRLLVTDRRVAYGDHVPAACLLRGVEPQDSGRELAWETALRAGRTDPAGCAAVPPHATAYADADVDVALVDVPSDGSRVGRVLQELLDGRPVDV